MTHNKRTKVVLLCHFSNEEIRKKISTRINKIEAIARKLLGKSNIATKDNDFAPWITNLIREFEKIDNIELHVVAPILNLSNDITEFNLRGVYYYFFKGNLSFPFENIIAKIRGDNRRYRHNTKLVQKLVDRIKPDIINLVGTENPYYSSTILGIDNIPIYVSAQTVYTNPARKELSGHVSNLNWNVELNIHKKETYYGCGGRMHRDLILKNNPNAIIFKMFFPIQRPTRVKPENKLYDFVSFSQNVSAKKGANDAIEALALVKKKHPEVKLNLVGHFNYESEFGKKLIERIEEFELKNNVVFTPYFPEHNDMHQHTQKARFALLPVKLDIISGSIIEAILLDLPLVTYKTTGTPYINKDGECILISDIGDIKALADNMIRLMEDPMLAESNKIKAKEFVNRTFDNKLSAERLYKNYKAVINHYHNGAKIPNELLFSTEEFPIYK